MFHSATLKLTAWYMAILIVISLLFSTIIYSTASNEVGNRLSYLQRNDQVVYFRNPTMLDTLRDTQVHEAQANLLGSLMVTNAFIWLAGGIGSYYLARRSLGPIEKAHEAQSRFTSDASHELRTPLASMKTELEVALRDTMLTKEEMRELLASNLEEVDKLTKLSHTLLQLSQLDYDSIEFKKIDLQPIVQSIIERYDKTGKRIRLISHTSLHSIQANQSNLEELLTILLDNALKYSPRDSLIDVTLIGQKHMAGFAITNQGEGIAPEALPHIFNRFYRADTSRTSHDNKGYGLGLSLAKKIVELHNGELTVSSALKSATTFRVLLPNFKQDQAKKDTRL